MNPIEIFRSGRHTDMHGQTLTFAEADIAAMAAAYSPALSEAPLVVGHPRTDAPAYGWVKGLRAEGCCLYAEPDQVDPAFAELVRAGRYKKLSASFYLPDSPDNPRPGAYYLRHVGFLGAQPPAVKGLRPVAFAEDGEGVLTVEFGEREAMSLVSRLAGLLRGVRDYIVERDGAEKADAALPAWELDGLRESAAVALAGANPALPGAAASGPAFSEPQPAAPAAPQDVSMDNMPKSAASPLPPSALPPDVLARVQALETREAAFAEKQRRAEADSVVNAAIREGRLTPAQAEGLAEFMARLPENPASGATDFAEKKDSARSSGNSCAHSSGNASGNASGFLVEFLNRLPRQVAFGEHSAAAESVDGLTPEEAALRVVAFRERMRRDGILVSATDALQAVKAGRDKENV